MKIIDRIFEYIKYKGVTISEFERKNSLSTGYLRKMKQRNADVGETIIVNILENCPDISVFWFVLGTGSMLKSNTTSISPEMPSIPPSDNTLLYLFDKNESLIRENERLRIELNKYRPSSPVGDQP